MSDAHRLQKSPPTPPLLYYYSISNISSSVVSSQRDGDAYVFGRVSNIRWLLTAINVSNVASLVTEVVSRE